MIALSQQATLETRKAKHAPRSLAEQRQTWRAEAIQALGSLKARKPWRARDLYPPLSARGGPSAKQTGIESPTKMDHRARAVKVLR